MADSTSEDQRAGDAVPEATGSAPAEMTAGERELAASIDAEQEAAERELNRRVPVPVKIGIAASIVAAVLISFALGRYPITPPQLLQTLYGLFFDASVMDRTMAIALIRVRLPRIVVVCLVGAALSVSGASYQGMFKNPLVSPDLLGASAGASLGACLAMLLDMGSSMIELFAFAGALSAVAAVVWLNKLVNRYDALLGLVLGGMLVSSLFQAGTSLVKYLADSNDKLPAITFWLMGSFNRVDLDDMAAVFLPMVAGFALLLVEGGNLNVLSFGEEEARSLGVNTKRVRSVVILASTVLVACSVAVSGIIGWVGLVVPHLARAIVGPNYKRLLPTAMVVGAGFLLVIDDIVRLASTVEMPIGILTAIFGVPFFVVIFRSNMRGW